MHTSAWTGVMFKSEIVLGGMEDFLSLSYLFLHFLYFFTVSFYIFV